VSVANAVGFKKCGGLKARVLWIPNQVGDDEGEVGDDDSGKLEVMAVKIWGCRWKVWDDVGACNLSEILASDFRRQTSHVCGYTLRTPSYPTPIGYPGERSECSLF
jgi:hypothetical protein